jgi:hypothetical protein
VLNVVGTTPCAIVYKKTQGDQVPTIEQIAALLSKQAGELQAVHAVLVAICQQTPPDSPLAKAIEYYLEQGYSNKLQLSTNVEYLQGFEEVAEFLKEALHQQPVGYK